MLIITGRVMMDKVNEPAKMLVPNWRKMTNIPNPNNPYTTDGIPARLMIAILIILVQELSGAYSDK